MRQRIRKRPMADINVVPYIDVMLVLLIIFMITAPLLSQGVKIDLPQAPSKPLEIDQNIKPLIISVNKDGKFYMNDPDKPLSAELVAVRVRAAVVKSQRDTGTSVPVYVSGDKNVPYGDVIVLMTLLQKAGVSSIGMITKSPDKVK